jgi:hypothetical protein
MFSDSRDMVVWKLNRMLLLLVNVVDDLIILTVLLV